MNFGQWERKSIERPIRIAAQLLVEGRTPEIFFRELVQQVGLGDRIDVRTFGDIAKDTLQTYLELFSSKAAFKERVTRLAIIRDAEGKQAESGFQSICVALLGAKLPVPSAMAAFTELPLQVGVYVLPDCSRVGMLETLCLEAAAECEMASPAKLLLCVDQFLDCVTRSQPPFENPTKARFAAYALARGVVDPQLGRAAQKRIIPFDSQAFEKLIRFLKRLGD
ncbi:MAG: hypothetical protein L0Z50_11370 [Verrucomicrobiales bacterium]|nr:hypothetical protein [Verrucomicrobiales bacterium]